MTAELNGRAALVTGGSRGIGAEIARALARAGADVAISWVSDHEGAESVVEDVKAAGGRALARQADMADAAAVTDLVDAVAAQFGRLDILVNNAGTMDSPRPLAEVPLDIVDRTLAVNVRGSIVASQAAARHLGAGGRVINVGSCLGERVPGPGVTLYATSKAAIRGLTNGLARELGTAGITVNQVSPGPVDTDMNPAGGPAAGEQRSRIALGHFGAVHDVASVVVFLAGEDAGFVTGADVAIDGGINV